MGLNRFDRPVQKDWSYPETYIPKLPILNYEILDQMLKGQQDQFDLARTISEKNPNVLQTEGDQQLYSQYRQMVDQGLDNVTKAYAEKGAAEGSRQYRQYIESLRKAWQPTGIATALNDRYTSYYTAKKQIDDFYKDDARPVNKTLAYRELQEQLQKPINYQDGRYQQITAPQTYKDPDFRKAINEMIKQIDDSGDTEFLGDRNKSWWIEKIKTTGRPEDKIRLATQALSEQPEFAAQLQRDARYQSLSIDPAKHQALFNSKIDKQLSNLESQINGKLGKDILEQQGYDTKDLNKAKKEFLDDQKRLAQQKKDNYDLNTELTRDVTEDYINYAAGFASQKVDKDLIYNKKLADQAKIQATREKTAALLSISDKLLQKEGPSVTVTTGVAQQLPEINKHYDALKQDLNSYKSNLDKSLNSNPVFNGWKFENVAFAHNLWNDTMKKLPANASEEQKQQAFSSALMSNSDYFRSNPENTKLVYEQMSSGNGGLQPAIKAYQDKQNEIERLDNARTHVAIQYTNTPEGKQSFNLLTPFRKQGESDEQLIQRSFNNPEQFKMNQDVRLYAGHTPEGFGKNNAAELYKSNMQRDISKLQKAGTKFDWGDMATYQVGFNKDDKSFQGVGDEIANSIFTGTQYQFSSEGKQGLTFRDADGNVLNNITKVDMGDFTVGKNSKGQPVLNYSATVTQEGQKAKGATVSIDIVPGSPEQEQINEGLKRAYIAKYNAGEMQSANAILDIMNVNGSLSDAGTQVQINNLTKSKAKPLNDVYKQDASGKLVPLSYMGYSGIDTKNSYQIQDPNSGSVLNYETYGLIDANGNKYAADVFITPDGKKVVTDIKQNMSSITQLRKGKEIRANTPVERETIKLPQGTLINLMDNIDE